MPSLSLTQWRCAGLALLTGIVMGVFWPVLGFDFVYWDDGITVTKNPMMAEPWSWQLVASFFGVESAMRFKPVHWVLMRVLYTIDGPNPAVWHVASLVLHISAAVMLLLVFAKVFRLCFSSLDSRTTELLAWLGAAIWAIHPLRVEPVAWATGSTYPLAAVFLLGSFLAYLHAQSAGPRNLRLLTVAWVCAVMAYATYPVGVTYGLWLVVVDIAILRNNPVRPCRLAEPEVRQWWVKHVLFLAPAMGAVGITVWNRLVSPLVIYNAAPSLDAVSWHERLLMAQASLAVFPLKLMWPAHLNPNHAPFLESVWTGVFIPSLALIVLLVAAVAFRFRKTSPRFVWIGAGFVGLSLPCLGLTESPVWPVDRYSYIVDMLLIGALVGALFGVIRRQAAHSRLLKFALVGAVAWMVVLGATTIRLLPVWRNTDTLFTHIESAPDFYRDPGQAAHVYKLWGYYYGTANRRVEAVAKLARAREVYMAAIKSELGGDNYSAAVKLVDCMEANLGIPPGVRRERGAWLLKLGRPQAARRDLQAALAEMPGDARTQELLLKLDIRP